MKIAESPVRLAAQTGANAVTVEETVQNPPPPEPV
jgi:hypothetical protein